MTDKQIETFLDTLFTNGTHEVADRLVLWRDLGKVNLGGWSRSAVRGLIKKHCTGNSRFLDEGVYRP